eukprot:superscaffoldBa00005179_g20009
MDQDSGGSEEEEFTCQLYDTLRKHLGSALPEVNSGWQLWRCVKVGILPFLRAATLFFHYLNSTAPPADLLGPGQWEALVRESQVLFVAGKTKGCFYPPPYLDDYGETDQGLKRGNPLHLCADRYRKIERLWRQHGIAEVIGHAQEANQTLVAIDWQHL